MMEKKLQFRVFLELLYFCIVFAGFVRSGEAQSKGFLVNCGSNFSIKVDGRIWSGDLAPNNNITLSYPGIAAAISALTGNSVFADLYKSARFFPEKLNYTFGGIEDMHILRLHFCPFPFENFNVNESAFDVIANGLKLMVEFNAPGEIAHKNLILQSRGGNSSIISLVQEYILPVSVGKLVIEFIPKKGSFGFVNAIEIVPVVDKLFKDSVTKVGGNEVNLNLNGRGIETMYRLNVGGPKIKPGEDTNLYRAWETDSSFMIIANAGSEIKNTSNITYSSASDSSIAPLTVYETARTMSNSQTLENRFNMSWKFEVHPDFDYLVRLHFCELDHIKENQRIFRIYINNKTAASNFDVYASAGGQNKAIHKDFFDPVSSKTDVLWVQLGPDQAFGAGTDALLNGLEIFKLSRNGNLAYVERFDSTGHSVSGSKMKIVWICVGAGLGTIAVVAIVAILFVCFFRKGRKESNDTKCNPPGWRPLSLHVSTGNARGTGGTANLKGVVSTRVGRKFTLSEIRAATNNFDDSLNIGVGGFGKVYKGETEDGTLVAIKRANPQSEQGLVEFETEIVLLSRLRHKHLVSLIGFCDEQHEMILVYEYMANGTLRSHLFGSDCPPLTWKQRLEVCIGAARGLHYLHTGSDRGIIHRDVKTTNILLDEDFVAKMADFGLSKHGPSMDCTHVSTAVKGSFGYLDPEYFRRQHLTEKSDVYSFGVVLFEVICARPVINPTLPKEQINLAEWAMKWQRQKSLETIIDRNLKGKSSPETLEKFAEIAEKCLADEGKIRPTMGEILWHLEYVLQLHEAWIVQNEGEDRVSSDGGNEDEERVVKKNEQEEEAFVPAGQENHHSDHTAST